MPLSPLTPSSVRYYVRRASGPITGPFESAALAGMLANRELDGSEEVSTDRQRWRAIREVFPAPSPDAARTAPLDLDPEDGILLAPLELGFGDRVDDVAAADERSAGNSDGSFGRPEADTVDPALDLGISLELVERRPSPEPAPALPHVPAREPAPTTLPLSRDAGVVARLLDAEVEQIAADATQPVRLEESARPPREERGRRRTMTAAREPKGTTATGRRWRPSRRALIAGGGVSLAIVGVVAAAVLDLPDRMRGEPVRATVLGPVADALAQDRAPAFSEAARLLEEAAGARRHVAGTRAAAAELLASSVVVHGADRGRIAHAEALLDMKVAGSAPVTAVARARAQAWVALAKGRWKDAERAASEVAGLAEADRAALRGWSALGRDDAARASVSFQTAAQAEPAAAPSRTATRYGLARAREADLSPGAEEAFRQVLKEAPAHVGAALGLARVSKLPAAGRMKLAEAVIATQARDASRAELAEAHALVARMAYELEQFEKAEAALKRARDADPAGIAAAVLAGDRLLAEGRTDEAVLRYRSALASPLSAARTSWLRFARIAALVEAERTAEAAAALAEVQKRLPDDARLFFWRARMAERSHPADLAGAERAYREALLRDPRFLPASLQLARLLVDQRRGGDGLAVLRRVENAGAAAAPLRVALGQALLASGNLSEATRTFRQAITADGKNAAAHLGLAAALESTGDLEGARVALSALATRTDIPNLGTRVAEILVKLGRRAEALATYRREIDAGRGSAITKVAAARLALDLADKDVARALAQSAVNDDPRTPGALLVLAEVWRANGDLGRALAELRRALAVDGSADVQLEYGRALAALGRQDDALSALSQAREIPEAAIERGRIWLARGDVDSALKELSVASGLLPRNAEAYLLLGEAEDRLGHTARAEAAWKSAVKLAPRSAEARYRLGRLHMDHGQAAAALPHLRAAAEQLPPRAATGVDVIWRADLYFQLGFAELRQGARDRALAAFKRYLDAAPADAPARAEVSRQIQQLASAR